MFEHKSQQAAYIISESTCAMIEAMGMQAENKQREMLGQSMAYTADDFNELINRYAISRSDVFETFGR